MQHFKLMRVENIGKLEGVFAEIQPGLALLVELDAIGQSAIPPERSFQRRMLKLAGFDLDRGLSLDPAERSAYVDSLNQLIWVWNGLVSRPSVTEFESTLRTYLGIGTDAQ